MTEKNEQELSLIQKIAELNLTGQGFSDYQKAKALNIAFESVKNAIRKAKNADVLAAASKKIFIFLNNNAKKAGYSAGKNTIKKIDDFMVLFQQICAEEYNGSLRKMYKNRFPIRSAYLWYIEGVISKNIEKSKKKK